MAIKLVNDDSLTSVANAIRLKAEISGTLEFPDGFVNAIGSIPEPTGSLSITENGTYDVTDYAEAAVNVPGIVPSGSVSITENGTVDVTQYAQAVVNVASGADKLLEVSLGNLSTTSTSAVSTGETITIARSEFNDYDALLVIIQKDDAIEDIPNNNHIATIGITFLYGDSIYTTMNTAYTPTVKYNYKKGGSGDIESRSSNTAHGVYHASSYSGSTQILTLSISMRYNSSYTGTINGDYTARIYGINLIRNLVIE